jgi:hypothetical protein
MTEKTKALFVGYLCAEMVLILALGYHHTHKPIPMQTETTSDFTPLDENFEKNQSEFIKTYAKGCYKRWKDSMTNLEK